MGFFDISKLKNIVVVNDDITKFIPNILSFLTEVEEDVIWSLKSYKNFCWIGSGSCCTVYKFDKYVLKITHVTKLDGDEGKEFKFSYMLKDSKYIPKIFCYVEDLFSVYEYVDTKIDSKMFDNIDLKDFYCSCIDSRVIPLDLKYNNFRFDNCGQLKCCDLDEFRKLSELVKEEAYSLIVKESYYSTLSYKEKLYKRVFYSWGVRDGDYEYILGRLSDYYKLCDERIS